MAQDDTPSSNSDPSYVTTLSETQPSKRRGRAAGADTVLALTVVWAREEPTLVGQVAVVGSAAEAVVGREGGGANPLPRLLFSRQRPGRLEAGVGFRNAKISRDQLVIEPVDGQRLRVRNIGRCALLHQGRAVESVEVEAGDVIQLGQQALFLVGRRPCVTAPVSAGASFAFGASDSFGIVGES